jgi:hypothetical protein
MPVKVKFLFVSSFVFLSLLSSCGKSNNIGHSFQMGEKVTVGPLIYTVLSAEWKAEIGDGTDTMVPKERYLVVHLSITNSGGAEAGSPLTVLVDKAGKEYPELQEAKALSGWLPIFRRLSPASTEDGNVVFDAPMGIYKLKIADGGDLENEKLAYVDLPLELQAPPNMQLPAQPSR